PLDSFPTRRSSDLVPCQIAHNAVWHFFARTKQANGSKEGRKNNWTKKSPRSIDLGQIHQRRRVEETTGACRATKGLPEPWSARVITLASFRHPITKVYTVILCNARTN